MLRVCYHLCQPPKKTINISLLYINLSHEELMSNTINPKAATAAETTEAQKDVSSLSSSKSKLIRISDFCCNNNNRRRPGIDYNNHNHSEYPTFTNNKNDNDIDDVVDNDYTEFTKNNDVIHDNYDEDKYTTVHQKNDNKISQSSSRIINHSDANTAISTGTATTADCNNNCTSIRINLQIINDRTIHQWYMKYCSSECNNTNTILDRSVNYQHSIVYTNNIQIFIQFQKFAKTVSTTTSKTENNWFWISKKKNKNDIQNDIDNDITNDSTATSITITTIPVQIVLVELDSTKSKTTTFTNNSNCILPIIYISSITAINLDMIIKPFKVNNTSTNNITNSIKKSTTTTSTSIRPSTTLTTTFFVLESYDSFKNNTSTDTTTGNTGTTTTTAILPNVYAYANGSANDKQQSRNSIDTLLSDNTSTTTNSGNVITINATAVTLQIIAKPYKSNFFLNYHYDQYSDDENDSNDNDTSNDDSNIQSNSNTNNKSSSLDTNVNNWIFPLPQTSIQIGTIVMTTKTNILSTSKFSHTNNNNSNNNQSITHQNFYYYQVKDIRIQNNDIQTIRTVMKKSNNMNVRILYQTTSQTKYRLQSPSLYNTIRAPPMMEQKEEHEQEQQQLQYEYNDNDETTKTIAESTIVNSSNIINNNNSYIDRILQPPYCISPHPDVYKVCTAFNRQQQLLLSSWNENTTSLNANGNNMYDYNNNNDDTLVPRIIHIVGNEKEYHTITAIEEACQFLGRNCIHVNGLATYAYCTDYFTNKQQIHQQQYQKVKRIDQREKVKKDKELQHILDMKNNTSKKISDDVDLDNDKDDNSNNENDDSDSDDNGNKNKNTTRSSSTRTGSIQDQIDGLKIVLDEAVYHSPCVIIFENFDQEFLSLSSNINSNPSTKDVDTIMERFICIINDWYQQQKIQQQQQEQLSIVRQQKQQQQLYGNSNISAISASTGSLVPAVTIVLHTTQTLSQLRKAAVSFNSSSSISTSSSSSTPGNNTNNKNISIIGSRVAYHIQRLCIMSSIHCTSTPTVEYIQYLCTIAINDYKRIPLQYPPKQIIVSALLKFCSNLLSRSANEIIPLIQMILYKLSLSSTKENDGGEINNNNNNNDINNTTSSNDNDTEIENDNRNSDNDDDKNNDQKIDTYESYYKDRMWTICEQFDDLIKGSITKNSNKNSSASNSNIPTTTWDDVGGLAHVRREIMDAIEIPLKYPHYFLPPQSSALLSSSSVSKLSLSTSASSTGILLYGPPGTGKTLVAKAVATECKLPFLSIKGPELLGSYVGESEANVRTVFAQARELARQHGRQDQQQQKLLLHRQQQQRLTKNGDKDTTATTTMPETVTVAAAAAASVLFFDELDSLAPRRGDTASGGNVMDRVVATLFAELDNTTTIDDTNDDSDDDNEFECDDNEEEENDENYTLHSNNNNSNRRNKQQKEIMPIRVFVIGATNRPDLLDPALLRPGRFDRLVYLGLNPNDRGNILLAQLRKLRIVDESSKSVSSLSSKSTSTSDSSKNTKEAVNKDNDFRQNIVNKILPILPEYVTGADLSTIASNALLRATERVCVQAEKELQRMQEEEEKRNNNLKNESSITLEDVLKGWDEDKLTPIVTLEDLLEAAKDVVPSVNADDIARYERMHEKYRVSPKKPSNVIP